MLKYSLSGLFAALTLAGITFAGAAPDAGRITYVALAFVSMCMAGSLAIPFLCKMQHRVFWAPYATTTGYALFVRGYETDPFAGLFYYALSVLIGETAMRDSDGPFYIPAQAVSLWSPSILGIFAGAVFFGAHRLIATTKTEKQP